MVSPAEERSRNDRPVIGILSEPNQRHTEYYVASSYVKWLEAAGARSIVIPFEADGDDVDDIFTQINGALLPGGSAVSAVPDSVRRLVTLAKRANDDGDTFPIWGTCLGFEYLMMVTGTGVQGGGQRGKKKKTKRSSIIQGGFDARNLSLPLEFTDDAATHSRVFADDGLRRILSSKPGVTMNYHIHGVEPDRFDRDDGLTSTFRVTATSVDRAGRPFVSAIEGRDYPFYGVQFHPEKTNFEYASFPGTNTPCYDINHSADAVLATFRLAHFFVSEARKNRGGEYTKPKEYPLAWKYESVNGEAFEQRLVILRSSSSSSKRVGDQAGTSASSLVCEHRHWGVVVIVAMLMAVSLKAYKYATSKRVESDSHGENIQLLG